MGARNRKKVAEAGQDGEKWLTSYADLVTLLLVFFVVMYAMANTDLKNFQKIALSLRLAFNGVGDQQPTVIVSEKQSAASQSQTASAPVFTDQLPTKRRDFVRVSTELTTFAQELNISGDIDIKMNIEGIIISLSDRLVFEPGSAELRPEALEVLEKVANIIQNVDNSVRVEGNTDDVPTNSPLYPTNWELSVARAVTIVHFMTEEGGIAPDRLKAAGNAEFNPVVPNDSRANRVLNRRADIVIIYPGESRRFSVIPPS